MSVINCFELAMKRHKEGLIRKPRVSFVCLRQKEIMKENKMDRSSATSQANMEWKETFIERYRNVSN